jgi:hypothetical protein
MTDQSVQLTLQDISLALQIIDAAAKRGSFEGSELSAVGSVRDRFAAFIDQNTPKEETETTEE